MPKRKSAAAAEVPATKSPKKEEKVAAKPEGKRGRGRPPLSAEEKAKRDETKKAKPVSGRGRGRPKGTTKKSKKK